MLNLIFPLCTGESKSTCEIGRDQNPSICHELETFLYIFLIAIGEILEMFEIEFCPGNISKFSFGYTETDIFLYVMYK